MHTTIASMAKGYPDVLEALRSRGAWTESRGLRHFEVLGATIILTDPTMCDATWPHRRVNRNIGIVEAAQLGSGESVPQRMLKVTKNFAKYMDGEVMHGVYGPRIRYQMHDAIQKLMNDPGSRQAVVTIWDPAYDNRSRKDTPCTVSLQFMIRDGRLHMFTNMRSNDAWMGFPYDVMQFCVLQQAVAWCLNVPLGSYHHHAASFHLYEEHFADSTKVESGLFRSYVAFDGLHFPGSALDRWEFLGAAVAGSLNGNTVFKKVPFMGDVVMLPR